MKGLNTLLKIRETYLGIAAAILFQLIFFIVWMTAYDGVNDRLGNLKIGLINHDMVIGEEIVREVQQKLPFQADMYTSIEQAKADLDERMIEMVIEIPSSFTESIQLGQNANIVYWINQANASLTKTLMENSAVQINDSVNRSLYAYQKNEVISQFTKEVPQLPIPAELAQPLGESITSMVNSLNDNPINAEIQKTNAVDKFAANLVPLMIIISSFVGAMVMIMQHQEAAHTAKKVLSKWELFVSRQLINMSVALLLPILTMLLMNIFHISSHVSWLTLYIFQSLLFFSFLLFAQVFVLVFGNLGMIFNILALSLQLVTSGVLVPKTMLSDWYINVASFLPATYGADGYYTIVFGGSKTGILNNIYSLCIVIAITLIISTVTVALKRNQNKDVMTDVSAI
ncbi:ABC transporter permease [Bacillus sp. FJAT-50079]|uniref:YhgE/Pip domain-containing protein n=1 Tax=Bacillus sp. FJAT-50079 TaxID=2833577 RepID=UPI001BC8D85F|nr:ABC transporter permease [Bacillus sp. FJAT-50079]MBS4209873.1 ABC transporter permease [Bacillus sp. FJAT-50079]